MTDFSYFLKGETIGQEEHGAHLKHVIKLLCRDL